MFDSATKSTSAEALKASSSLYEGPELDIVRTAYSIKIHPKIKTLNESTVGPLLDITSSPLSTSTKRQSTITVN